MTETEIRLKGMEILSRHMGLVEAERFVSLIKRESFDYTTWRRDLFEGLSIEIINKMAMREHQDRQH